MSQLARILRLVHDRARFREEIVEAADYGEGTTIELSGQDLAILVYALSTTYLDEWLEGREGNEKIRAMISGTSETLMALHAAEEVDKLIENILGRGEAADGSGASGRENPEEAGDGA